MSRRGKGEGTICQRPNGEWLAAINIGCDANGKRLRKYIRGKTKKAVADKLTKLANQKLDGMLEVESKLSVGDYLDRWLTDSVKMSTAITTHASYSSHVELYLKPNIGGVKLVKLTPSHVARLYSQMEVDGKSPRMRQMVHATLHRALKVAMKWGLVQRNVADAVDRPKAPKVEIKPLCADEVRKLLKAAESDRLHALYVLAIGAGMRCGELLALQWQDIDLKAGMIAVRRTLIELSGQQSFGEPKSAKGRRAIHLPTVAVDALRLHKAHMMQEGHGTNPLVFVTTEGTPFLRSDLRRHSFLPLLKRAGISIIRFHDLRHTSATMLLSEGIHPKIVQERLGHSTINLTLDTYSHVLPSMQEDAAGKLNAAMKRGVG